MYLQIWPHSEVLKVETAYPFGEHNSSTFFPKIDLPDRGPGVVWALLNSPFNSQLRFFSVKKALISPSCILTWRIAPGRENFCQSLAGLLGL